MKCPHCLDSFHHDPKSIWQDEDLDGGWVLAVDRCPACGKLIILLGSGTARHNSNNQLYEVNVRNWALARPKGISRTPCPSEIPSEFVNDYKEACAVLFESPKASAALSRRCLQHVLREKAGVKKGDLANEIEQVLQSGKLPTHLHESIDAIRNIGNFAAHPMKSQQSGEVFPVEPGEAEWNLDVLEALFDFYFVQPAILAKKRNALNAKLQEAGKPAVKG